MSNQSMQLPVSRCNTETAPIMKWDQQQRNKGVHSSLIPLCQRIFTLVTGGICTPYWSFTRLFYLIFNTFCD